MEDPEHELTQLVACMRAIGHPISADGEDRARRILTGELTEDQAYAELQAKYEQPPAS